MSRTRALVPLVLFLGAQTACFAVDPAPAEREMVFLDQGWSADERQDFYYTTQGSQLLPYDWFIALEHAAKEDLFRSDGNMRRFGFIPQQATDQRNPDGLPIGFVKDDVRATGAFDVKRSFLGPDFDPKRFPPSETWLGLTCAACHTSEFDSGEKTIRIDGGAALADTQQFLRGLADAVEATRSDEEKMTRFAKRVLTTTYNEGERDALQERVRAYAPVLVNLAKRGEGTTPFGLGRLDAFGAILNEICETALELPENHHPADAPASYPFLWDTPQLDWVQWNGSANNPMARNVGEALGVFAQLKLTAQPPADQFRSTAHFRNLFRLEQQIDRLKPPRWPEEYLGKIDPTLRAQGQELFVQNCAKCHGVRDGDTREYPMTAANSQGRRFIKTVMVPAEKIGTDPKLIENLTTRLAKPGALRDAIPGSPEKVPRPVLLAIAVDNVIKRKIKESKPVLEPDTIAAINGFRCPEPPPNPSGYKARPLAGIWATAPFLHNGSVPTLYHLLLPEERRPRQFYVGGRRFDSRYVGWNSSDSSNVFLFRVFDDDGSSIAGNSNKGHSGKFYTQRRTADDTWQNFTDDERWALIEYMKALD